MGGDEDDLAEGGLEDGFEMSFPYPWNQDELAISLTLVLLQLSKGNMPPTPAAGRIVTSTAASSGSSSRL